MTGLTLFLYDELECSEIASVTKLPNVLIFVCLDYVEFEFLFMLYFFIYGIMLVMVYMCLIYVASFTDLTLFFFYGRECSEMASVTELPNILIFVCID